MGRAVTESCVADALLVPANRLFEAILERGCGAKPEALGSARRIEHATGLSIRLGCIPSQFSAEVRKGENDLRKAADRNFLAAANIDWLRVVVSLRGHDDSRSSIAYE